MERTSESARMNEAQRQRLLQQQTEVLRYLLHGGEPPQGFDVKCLDAAARSLQRKRRRVRGQE